MPPMKLQRPPLLIWKNHSPGVLPINLKRLLLIC
jgi:hypothetical protein